LSRRTTRSRHRPDLGREVRRAAAGDLEALSRLYQSTATAAWGVAVVATKSTELAEDAVIHGFAALLERAGHEEPDEDVEIALLTEVRLAAIEVTGSDEQAAKIGLHSRAAPLPMVDTFDPSATLALATLDEPSRLALFLAEHERTSPERLAELLDEPTDEVTAILDDAKERFRAAYASEIRSTGAGATCEQTLVHAADYVARTLPAKEAAAIERHLAECAKGCSAGISRIADVRGTIMDAVALLPMTLGADVVRHWSDLAPSRPITSVEHGWWAQRRRRPTTLLTAASITVVFSAALVFVEHDRATGQSSTVASQLSVATSTSTAVAVASSDSTLAPTTTSEPPSTTAPAPTTTVPPASTIRSTTPTGRIASAAATTTTTTARPAPPLTTTTTTDPPPILIDLPPGTTSTTAPSHHSSGS